MVWFEYKERRYGQTDWFVCDSTGEMTVSSSSHYGIVADRNHRLSEQNHELAELNALLNLNRTETQAILRSTFWRLTGLIRPIASRLPPSLRRRIRELGKSIYWRVQPSGKLRLADICDPNRDEPGEKVFVRGFSDLSSHANL